MIVDGIVVGLTVCVAIVVLCTGRLRTTPAEVEALKLIVTSLEFDKPKLQERSCSGSGKQGRLCYLRDDENMCDLKTLLKSPAEILGSGEFGCSYKAVLENGSALVVKRFRHMNNVGKEDFQEHMRRLGRLKHPNLLPLVAYCYRAEEKLLVTDFIDNGSLALHLHGLYLKSSKPYALSNIYLCVSI